MILYHELRYVATAKSSVFLFSNTVELSTIQLLLMYSSHDKGCHYSLRNIAFRSLTYF